MVIDAVNWYIGYTWQLGRRNIMDVMKKFGDVLECHSNKHGAEVPEVDPKDNKGSEPVSCGSGNQGSTVELKVGRHNDQHIVSIEPNGKGAKLALVYVRTHGKEDTI